jgi:hypothetical protein
MSLETIAGLVFRLVGLLAIVFAGWQLVEVRRRRRVDTYWQFFTTYSSADYRQGREALGTISREVHSDQHTPESNIEELAEDYLKRFHSSFRDKRKPEEDKRVQDIDRRARTRVRFMNTAGALTRRRLIDEDLLFELIGPAFNRDYEVIQVIVTGNRKAHEFCVYRDIEFLKERYDKWANRNANCRKGNRLRESRWRL